MQQFGLIGLGVMGQNLALNVERQGYGVSVYNRTADVTNEFLAGAASGKNVIGFESLAELVASLSKPRRIMLMVKAGPAVDAVIDQLLPLVDEGDLITDGGNSHYLDTERRAEKVEGLRIDYLGMGVSGGEEGALWGPSMMPGGSRGAWHDVRDMMQKVAANAEEDGAPCVDYIGPGGAGHFVKMVHNGIEYGDMQLIAESYDLLTRGLGLDASECRNVFAEWDEGELSGFLIELTANVLGKLDDATGKPMVDVILDRAGQKGTGKWTTQAALDLGAAVPTITAAVDARIVSSMKEARVRASGTLEGPTGRYDGDREVFVDAVRDALYSAKICCYAQGMSLLGAASTEYGYDLNPASIARIWRAGCIIRASLLGSIAAAYERDPEIESLLVDDEFRGALGERQESWRHAVATGVALGVPMPAMASALAYYDSYRSERLPANLIQAQRDSFGAHTFERNDTAGTFHVDWSSK